MVTMRKVNGVKNNNKGGEQPTEVGTRRKRTTTSDNGSLEQWDNVIRGRNREQQPPSSGKTTIKKGKKQQHKEEQPLLGVVGKIEKSPKTDIVFAITEYKGNTKVDIREYDHNDKYDGPTPRGVSIVAEEFEEFYNNVVEIYNRLKEHCIIL